MAYRILFVDGWKRFRGNGYHLTKMYFWIHIVRYYRALFKHYAAEKKQDVFWNFDGFLSFCQMKRKKTSIKCKILNEDWWKEYYSDDVMEMKGFDGMDASKVMVPSDIKPLPQLQLVAKQK